MAQVIVLKRSSQPNKKPDVNSLNLGEIAVNTYDGKAFIKRSGSAYSVEEIVITNAINTGSITLTQTGSFGELVVSNDANIQQDLYVTRDIITNGDIDAAGDITGSNIHILGNSMIGSSASSTHLITGSLIVSGSTTQTGTNNLYGNTLISGTLTISSSQKYVDYTNVANIPTLVSSSSQLTASYDARYVLSSSFSEFSASVDYRLENASAGAGPNTFDFNLDPNAAGTVNYIEDSTSTTRIYAYAQSASIVRNDIDIITISDTSMNVTTGSITANYMHLAKYITSTGDLDFNV